MLDIDILRKVFAEKLLKTGDLDKAFIKAVWVAYKQGIKDAEEKKVSQ